MDLERTMSSYVGSEAYVAAEQFRSRSWSAFFHRAIELARICRERRRQRRELLDYIASDHRAAADIGITPCEARSWSERPFRRSYSNDA